MTNIIDVDLSSFDDEVIAASFERPVVIDFWAAWCPPCRELSPILEQVAGERPDDVRLAKVDVQVDGNMELAERYGVRAIPLVVGIRDGEVRDSFSGLHTAAWVGRFVDGLQPTPADRAVSEARRADGEARIALLEEALTADPQHREATLWLASLLAETDPERALELVKPLRPDDEAEAVAIRADLAAAGTDVATLETAVAENPEDGPSHQLLGRAHLADKRYEEGIEHLLAAVEHGPAEVRRGSRAQLLRLFTQLGPNDERALAAQPRLARLPF